MTLASRDVQKNCSRMRVWTFRRFLEKILPYGTRPDYTFAFLTSNPFVRYSGVRACSTPAMSSVPHARTENRYTLSGLENDWSHTALL